MAMSEHNWSQGSKALNEEYVLFYNENNVPN